MHGLEAGGEPGLDFEKVLLERLLFGSDGFIGEVSCGAAPEKEPATPEEAEHEHAEHPYFPRRGQREKFERRECYFHNNTLAGWRRHTRLEMLNYARDLCGGVQAQAERVNLALLPWLLEQRHNLAMTGHTGHANKARPGDGDEKMAAVVIDFSVMFEVFVGVVAHSYLRPLKGGGDEVFNLAGGELRHELDIAQMLKIASWNVNSLRTRLPHVLRWWQEHQPDVLCLQETKVENGLFPLQPFTELGLHVARHGQKSYNGVAIISKLPLREVDLGFNGHNLEEQTRLIAATVQVAEKPVRILSAYVPNGESLTSAKFGFKQAFYAHLAAHIAAEVKQQPRLVLVGDFNVAADERDVANPTRAAKDVLFTPQERQWLRDLCQQGGLHDALRLIDQTANLYTWWDYRTYGRSQNNGMRIDYVFVSEVLKDGVREVVHHTAERGMVQPSDHVPVVARIKV